MIRAMPLVAAVLTIALIATAGTSAAKTQQQRDRAHARDQ
jgi:archaellin